MNNYHNQKAYLDQNFRVLGALSQRIFSSYNQVKEQLSTCKLFGVAIIGNPLYPIENKLINLNYLALQHIKNCEVYIEVVEISTVDRDLISQLEGLFLVTQELQEEYSNIIEVLKKTKINFLANNIKSA